ncbi:UDP-N-acetylmuramoylalanine--D-glutamate ligase [Arcticibacter svalbardensis MN12-7]|uniref:UDP-N-acetylmuramoylalanine--D-glutamate ligase n=1 Tax=Arcticibacter svalbardensis MN12-7 TaxID=1150600 RepID=R9GRJ4_9SPHI|nr:UDP-N-acetylmuramoyl-L-alanine--D-glutamate ligase [Arcticibacter svalbardensis]EOR94140.1 UDP-N-acetylmuramoylalanine--D-glutamate ligase [Arcticibacter svalbardensis MN12-7]
MDSKHHIVILGAGESGAGAAVLALKQGFEVFVSDSGPISPKYVKELEDAGIEFEQQQHSEERILSADEVIKSPGIPEKAPLIKKIREKGISIISEIEFASRYSNAKTICITGSNGKTTTTMLTYHILKDAGLHVGLAGNIGQSYARQVAQKDFDWYVLEISSFMLDDMYEFKADIAVLLNITPDHLDRYDYKMENYAESKIRIIRNQSEKDVFIYCADDPETIDILKRHPAVAITYPFSIQKEVEIGAYIKDEQIIIKLDTEKEFKMTITDLALQGKHNIYNSMASGIVAKVLELRNENVRASMGDFKNIEHRLEDAGKISGVNFINDSKATNVNSTWYALESMTTDVILILGGVDKGNDYNMLKDLVKAKVKSIVCLGKDNKRIHEAFEDDVDVIVNTFSAPDAVKMAYHLAKKGDTVLLSPACASFDLFKNYEDRGDQFKAAIKEL